jgi:Tol biopolymer transport system component
MEPSPDRRLNSWKEIAGYLDRDLRTVQRWEDNKGLPVYRVPGGKRQAVFAYQGEIDRWLQAGGGDAQPADSNGGARPAELRRTVGGPPDSRVRSTAVRRYGLGVAAAIFLVAAAGLAAYRWLGGRGPGKASRALPEKQLTANPPEDRVVAAAISPDGKHLAYRDLTGLFVRAIESGETRAISVPREMRSLPGMLQWLPDGGQLLGEVYAPEGGEIWVIPVSGTGPPKLVRRLAAAPAISPDGRSIAFLSGGPAAVGRELWVCGINGESPRRLATSEQLNGLWNPVWSPDGRWIAYWRNKGTHPFTVAIEIQPASGGPTRTLSPESSSLKTNWLPRAGMSWALDWRLIVALTEDSGDAGGSLGDGSLWSLSGDPALGAAQRKLERLARWPDSVVGHLSLAADGKRLALTKIRPRHDVYVGDLGRDGRGMQAPRRFTLDTRGSEADAWAPDSEAIVYESCRDGKWEIFRQGLNETVPEKAIKSSGHAWNGTFSPDRAWYLYWEEPAPAAPRDPHPGRLMRRPVAGGQPELVLEEPYNDLLDFKCPLKPGSDCVLSRREGKEMVFYSLDPVRGEGDRIADIEVKTSLYTGAGDVDWSVSPDGSRLAVVDAQPRIEVLARSGRTWREISVEPGWGPLRSIAWTTDGKAFYAVSWLSGTYNLLHVTTTGGVEALWSKRPEELSSLRPSPDGKRLAFTVETRDSNAWMIDNF